MKTSYKDCHPVVEEHLLRGEHCRCLCKLRASDSEFIKRPVRIIAYIHDHENDLGYYLDYEGIGYDTVEPVMTEARIIDAVSMMKGMIERGWVQMVSGDWELPSGYIMAATVFLECGTRPNCIDGYLDWMVEEIEI